MSETEPISEIDKSSSESSSHSENEESVKVSRELQENVKKFVLLSDLLKKKQDEITELRKQKKPCEEYILKFLDQVNEDTVDVTDGKIKKNKSEIKNKLDEDIVKLSLQEKIDDPKIIEEIIKSIEGKRGINSKVKLERKVTKPKKIGKKKK